jgi:hypothetical protein
MAETSTAKKEAYGNWLWAEFFMISESSLHSGLIGEESILVDTGLSSRRSSGMHIDSYIYI